VVDSAECLYGSEVGWLAGADDSDSAFDTVVGRSAVVAAFTRSLRQSTVGVTGISETYKDSCDAGVIRAEIECPRMNFKIVGGLLAVHVVDDTAEQSRRGCSPLCRRRRWFGHGRRGRAYVRRWIARCCQHRCNEAHNT
jgi:hypothetical protein